MKLNIVGAGMGSVDTLTGEGRAAICEAELIIGAERLFSALPNGCRARLCPAVDTYEVLKIVKSAGEKSVCVLMSGDAGFYSGTKRLIEVLKDYEVGVIPGISSVQYFAARLKRPWQDWKLVSAHGVDECRAVDVVRDNAQTFFLTGGKWTARKICRAILESGLEGIEISVGERLGAEDEWILTGDPEKMAQIDFDDLCVMLVDNPVHRDMVSCGFKDETFLRGEVPMTKSEVRSIVLSKLRLHRGDVVYDVGAGTGSVSVEAALLIPEGHVYSVESNREACNLIEENTRRMCVHNLTCVCGGAPEAFDGLPVPDAAFIGGSKDRFEPIVKRLIDMNPRVRLVATSVTLETLERATATFREIELSDLEIVQVAVNRVRFLGKNSMLTAQNPVFVLSGGGRWK